MRRRRAHPEAAFVSRNGPDDVGRKGELEVLALGVAEQRERRWAQARGVVDEDVQSAKRAENLQRDRMDVLLAGDVADNADDPGIRGRDSLDSFAIPGDEGDVRAAAGEFANQREAEPGCPACDGDAKSNELRRGR